MTQNIKLPPQNLEAEQTVLGSLLIDKTAIFRVADMITSKDFYSPAHETIYDAIIALYDKRQPIDILSVTTYLKEKDTIGKIGGSAYLADLTNQVTTASHVEHYAKIIKDKHSLRQLLRASSEIAEDVFGSDAEVEDLMDDAEQKILSISQQSLPQNFLKLKDELAGAAERIAKLHEGGGKLRGIPTGFTQLDLKLSGLQKSELIIIGARPSVGKTSLALDIGRQAALAGAAVGFFSLEMARDEILDRIISAESQVPLFNIRTGKIKNDMEFSMIQNGLDKLSATNFFIDDSSSLNVLQMRSMARRLQSEHGLDLLIIDYLQLIRPRTNSDNVVQQITEISRGLKSLARELKIPVVALSQLSRNVDQRGDEPRLSDLRDSGSIEQDADMVMFIHRKYQTNKDKSAMSELPPDEQNTTKIIIAKHRNGPTGEVELHFDWERATFKSIDKRFDFDQPL